MMEQNVLTMWLHLRAHKCRYAMILIQLPEIWNIVIEQCN